MNLSSVLLIAQAAPPTMNREGIREIPKPNGGAGTGNTDIIVILGCALALSVLLFVWAFFIRKRPKSARGSLVVERRRKGSRPEEENSHRRKRKRRPDHPDNWGRNPTLGETGGLPPTRSEEISPAPDAASDGSQSVQPR